MASKLGVFLTELKRRKVTRVVVVYALVGIGVVEAAGLLVESLELPFVVWQIVTVLALLGFPIAIVLAWALEITPEGIQRTPDLTPEQLASQTPEKWSPSSWVLGTVGLIVVLGAGYFAFFRGGASQSDLVDNRVLVTIFENQTGDPELDLVGQMAADFVIRELGQMGAQLVEVLPMETSRAVAQVALPQAGATTAGSPICAQAEQLGAGLTLSGTYYLVGDSLSVQAQMVDVSGCRVLRTFATATASLDEPSAGLATFARRAAGGVALHFEPGWSEYGDAVFSVPPSYAAYREMTAGWDDFLAGQYGSANEHYLRALEIDSTYLAAMTNVADYYLNRSSQFEKGDSVLSVLEGYRDRMTPFEQGWLDINRAWLEGDREGAYRTTRRLAERYPGGQAVYGWAFEAVNMNRPREAVEVLSGLDPERPDTQGWVFYWTVLAAAHRMLGHHEEALRTAIRGREQYPERYQLAQTEGYALIALGRVEESVEVIDEIRVRWGQPGARRNLARALYSYGHREAAREVLQVILSEYEAYTDEEMAQRTNRAGFASTLYLLGRHEDAREIYLELAEAFPENVSYQGNLGVIAARLGEVEEAQRISDELEVFERMKLQGVNHYWRACIAAQLGELDRAVRLLQQAHREGRSFGLWLWHDVDLGPLRGHPAFEEFIRPKG